MSPFVSPTGSFILEQLNCFQATSSLLHQLINFRISDRAVLALIFSRQQNVSRQTETSPAALLLSKMSLDLTLSNSLKA